MEDNEKITDPERRREEMKVELKHVPVHLRFVTSRGIEFDDYMRLTNSLSIGNLKCILKGE